MESQILQQDDLSIASLVYCIFDLLAHTIVRKGNALAKQLLELGNNRLETVLGVWLAIGPAKMAHENHGFGTMVNGVFDGGECADDALVVCDFLVAVEGNVEVDLDGIVRKVMVSVIRIGETTYSDKHALALDVYVGD